MGFFSPLHWNKLALFFTEAVVSSTSGNELWSRSYYYYYYYFLVFLVFILNSRIEFCPPRQKKRQNSAHQEETSTHTSHTHTPSLCNSITHEEKTEEKTSVGSSRPRAPSASTFASRIRLGYWPLRQTNRPRNAPSSPPRPSRRQKKAPKTQY